MIRLLVKVLVYDRLYYGDLVAIGLQALAVFDGQIRVEAVDDDALLPITKVEETVAERRLQTLNL